MRKDVYCRDDLKPTSKNIKNYQRRKYACKKHKYKNNSDKINNYKNCNKHKKVSFLSKKYEKVRSKKYEKV